MEEGKPESWRQHPPVDLAKLAQKAEDIPGFLNTFLRLHLNVRTQSDVRWLSLEQWDAQDREIDAGELEGQPCYCGLDLSTTTDLSAFAMVFPREDPKGFDVLSHFWVPARTPPNARSATACPICNGFGKAG